MKKKEWGDGPRLIIIVNKKINGGHNLGDHEIGTKNGFFYLASDTFPVNTDKTTIVEYNKYHS